MSTYSYSLKWDLTKNSSTISVTATRITFGELCEYCGNQSRDASTLSYRSCLEYDVCIPVRDCTPIFQQTELTWLINTSLSLLSAMQYGVSANSITPFHVIGKLAGYPYWVRNAVDDSYHIAALSQDYQVTLPAVDDGKLS